MLYPLSGIRKRAAAIPGSVVNSEGLSQPELSTTVPDVGLHDYMTNGFEVPQWDKNVEGRRYPSRYSFPMHIQRSADRGYARLVPSKIKLSVPDSLNFNPNVMGEQPSFVHPNFSSDFAKYGPEKNPLKITMTPEEIRSLNQRRRVEGLLPSAANHEFGSMTDWGRKQWSRVLNFNDTLPGKVNYRHSRITGRSAISNPTSFSDYAGNFLSDTGFGGAPRSREAAQKKLMTDVDPSWYNY